MIPHTPRCARAGGECISPVACAAVSTTPGAVEQMLDQSWPHPGPSQDAIEWSRVHDAEDAQLITADARLREMLRQIAAQAESQPCDGNERGLLCATSHGYPCFRCRTLTAIREELEEEASPC